MVTKVLTGHIYNGSAFETSDSCGNCSGAACDGCDEFYKVNGVTFADNAKAQEYNEEIEVAAGELMGKWCKDTEDKSFFVNGDGNLYVDICIGGRDLDVETVIVKCNPEASMFDELYDTALDYYTRTINGDCDGCPSRRENYYGDCRDNGCTNSRNAMTWSETHGIRVVNWDAPVANA